MLSNARSIAKIFCALKLISKPKHWLLIFLKITYNKQYIHITDTYAILFLHNNHMKHFHLNILQCIMQQAQEAIYSIQALMNYETLKIDLICVLLLSNIKDKSLYSCS